MATTSQYSIAGFSLPGAALTLLVTLAGCATTAPPAGEGPAFAIHGQPGTSAQEQARMQVIFTAMQMVGVPYRWGGAGPDAFDCSGLVQYAYRNAGIALPRTASEQLDATDPVPLKNATAGDLLFFRDGRSVSHVAIYLGDGRFVHAPRGGRDVSLDSFANTYYRTHFKRAGRVIPAPQQASTN